MLKLSLILRRQTESALASFARWRGIFSLGALEQMLISGSSFVFTAIMAHKLGPVAFGQFSVAWSVMILLEASLWGIFGDAVPATAHRLPDSLWPELRSALIIISSVASVGFAMIPIAAGGVMAFLNPGLALPFVASALTLIALRFQNAFRRICYLDNIRTVTAFAGVIYACLLLGGSGFMVVLGRASPAVAFIPLTIASTGAAATIWFRRRDFVMPPPRLIRWCTARLWRTGRWTFASSVMSWAGNLGIIPLSSAISGVSAAGTFRALQTLLIPMSQLTIIFMSILVPNAARRLRRERNVSASGIAVRSMALIGALSLCNALVLTFGGLRLFQLLFGESGRGATALTIAVLTFGFAIESVRYGCLVVLLGLGRTKILMFSQTSALISVFALLPFFARFGILGIVTAVTIANNIGTAIVLIYFILTLVGKRAVSSSRPADVQPDF